MVLSSTIQMVFAIAEVVLCAFGLVGNSMAAISILHPLVSSGAAVLLFGIALTDTIICVSIPVVELSKLFALDGHSEHPNSTNKTGSATSLSRSYGVTGGQEEWFSYVWCLQTVWFTIVSLLVVAVTLERFFSVIAWIRKKDLVSRLQALILGVLTLLIIYVIAGVLTSPYFLVLQTELRGQTLFSLPKDILTIHESFVMPAVQYLVPFGMIMLFWFLIVMMLCIGHGIKQKDAQADPRYGYQVQPDLMTIGGGICVIFFLTHGLGASLVCIDLLFDRRTVFGSQNVAIYEILGELKTLLAAINAGIKPILYFSASERIRLALTDICTCQCRRHAGHTPSYYQMRPRENNHYEINHDDHMELTPNHI